MENDVYVWRYALTVAHARNDDDDNDDDENNKRNNKRQKFWGHDLDLLDQCHIVTSCTISVAIMLLVSNHKVHNSQE